MNFCGELQQFHFYMASKCNEVRNMKSSHINLCDTIAKGGIQFVFPDTETTLLVFLTPMITSCSTECSFSHLKKIKTFQEQQCVRADWIHFPSCVRKQTYFVESALMNLSRILQSENLEGSYFNFSIHVSFVWFWKTKFYFTVQCCFCFELHMGKNHNMFSTLGFLIFVLIQPCPACTPNCYINTAQGPAPIQTSLALPWPCSMGEIVLGLLTAFQRYGFFSIGSE